jgi:hypothetical protein
VVGGSVAGLPGCAVDLGEDFQVAEVVFDENYFYCAVEPMLFQQGCGSGDPSRGEDARGCHFSVTAFRLSDYGPPRVSDSWRAGVPGVAPNEAAQANFGAAQLFMDRNPERAQILLRPTRSTAHPRVIFQPDSEAAEVLRQWAMRVSSQ